MDDMRQRIREECLEREDAFCTSKCPFRLDVREFVSRVARGGFNSAYRFYSNAVGFPAIVSALCDEPCRAVCPRKDLDEAVFLRMLEDACVRHASNTKPNNYNLPSKNLRIAIVGGGAGGLACALRLCNKKYDVSVYEMTSEPGGAILRFLPPELVRREIELQFMYEKYRFFPNATIESIDKLAEGCDAVYVSTGRSGDYFGLKVEKREGICAPYATSKPGIFMGGGLTGASCVEAIAQGLRAALVIESFLKSGVMKSDIAVPATKMILDAAALKHTPSARPAAGTYFSRDEAVSEASRCVRCRCDAC